jgi:hypothetical protein
MRKLIELVSVATWPTVSLDDFRAAIAQKTAPPRATASNEMFNAADPRKIERRFLNSIC